MNLLFIKWTIKDSKNSTQYQRSIALSKIFNFTALTTDNNSLNGDVIKVDTKSRLIFSYYLLKYCLRNRRNIDVIYGTTDPYSISICFLLKIVFGFKWILDIWDHPTLHLKSNNYIKYKIKKHLHAVIIEDLIVKADLWIIGMHKRVLDYLPEYSKPKIIITNGVSIEKNEQWLNSKKYLTNGEINICYIGSLNKKRQIINICKWISEYDCEKKVKLKVAGKNNGFDFSSFDGSDNLTIEYVGFLEHSEAIKIVKESDIALCLLSTDVLNYRFSYPIKLFEYLYYQTIVIATNTEAISNIINHKSNGFLIDNTKEDFIRTLSEIERLSEEELKKIGKKAFHTSLNYNWKEINDSLNNQIMDILVSNE